MITVNTHVLAMLFYQAGCDCDAMFRLRPPLAELNRSRGRMKEAMNGGWWAFVGGAATGVVISTVQRAYLDVSFVALLGVGLGCGALFKVVMFVATKKLRRS